MIWIPYVIAALHADIIREAAAADECLRLARAMQQACDPGAQHQIAKYAATTLLNASALAAELIALGGTPPCVSPRPEGNSGKLKGPVDHLVDARSALLHYRRRLLMASRVGLDRLQEVFCCVILRYESRLKDAQPPTVHGRS